MYHQGELLYEGGEESSYHLGSGIEAVWQSERNHYYHQDEQLSTVFITNEKQEIQNHYQYDAFGNGICQEEGISNRIRYTGQQYDGVTGQYYLRARYYNPIAGRFLQEDVYQGDGLNLYAYCGNNPVRYYDPSGYSGTPQLYNTGCPGTEIEEGQGNPYPPRTPKAEAEAQLVVNVGNAIKAFKQNDLDKARKNNLIDLSSRVTAIFLHENNTVSVGISGPAKGTKANNSYAKDLERSLNEMAGYEKYSVFSITDADLYEQIGRHEKAAKYPEIGDSVPYKGVCAENKAASAAHGNDSPIIGFDVRFYHGDGVGNHYPLEYSSAPNQMDNCDRCKFNGEIIINYANN